MSYTKHNYKKGDELLASQLNDMDDQIALNEQTADTLVTVSNTQPSAAKNRVWVKATPSEIEIPTMEDHNELSRHLNDKQNAPATAGTAGQVLSLDSQLNPVWSTPSGGGDGDLKSLLILGDQAANVPASATSSGKAGQIAYDSNYIYVCVADNTWKRATLETW